MILLYWNAQFSMFDSEKAKHFYITYELIDYSNNYSN